MAESITDAHLALSDLLVPLIETQEATRANTIVKPVLSAADLDRIVEMAWEDRTPFDAIKAQFGTSEKEVINIMRAEMKASSFRMWRARVQGRATKHQARRGDDVDRFHCTLQRTITGNKISKRR